MPVSGGVSTLVIVDISKLWWASFGAPEILISNTASFEDPPGTQINLFQRDESAMRWKAEHDLKLERTNAAVRVTSFPTT